MITSKEFATSSDRVIDRDEMFGSTVPHLYWKDGEHSERSNAFIFSSGLELHRLKLMHPFNYHFVHEAVNKVTKATIKFIEPGWMRGGYEYDESTHLHLQSADAGRRGVLLPVPYCYWHWAQTGLVFHSLQIAPEPEEGMLRLPKTMYEMYKLFVKKYRPFVYYDLRCNHAARLENAI